MRRAPSISFVIPVRDDASRLARCLKTIAASGSPDTVVECVVADNGSTDASPEVAASLGAQVLSLPGLPVSALRNRAAAVASGQILAFVDADHELGPGWIAAVLDVFRDPRVGATGALCLSPPHGPWIQRMYGVLRGRTVGHTDTEWLGSGNLAIRRALFNELAGFDESLETCEDVDLCHRVRRAGWRLVADDRLENVHLGDPETLGSLFRSERWRGRDNLRVSLRSVPSLADLPSILIPVVNAVAMLAAATGLLLAPLIGRPALVVAAASAALILALAGLRAARMAMKGRLRTPHALVQAFIVAAVYDAGRASSLFWPARHHRVRTT